MPNGYHNNPAIDLIVHRHAEHGQPHFRTHVGSAGVVAVHLEHHGGHAYLPRWEAVNLSSLLYGRGRRTTRGEMDVLAAEFVTRVTALLASNPDSRVHATRASAFLAVHDFCVALGDYHLYTRSPGRRFQWVEPPLGLRDETIARTIEIEPRLSYLARDTYVQATCGLMTHEPSACVVDLTQVEEWLVSTAPLHKHPRWDELARVPLDSVDAAGYLLVVVRDHAVARSTDQLVIRGRRSPRAATEAAKSLVPTSTHDEIPGGGLRVVWGPDVGHSYPLGSECLLGRGLDCDIDVDDDRASRHHARLTRVGGRYEIRDVNSRHGTFVNGVRTERHLLTDGDQIAIGSYRFRFWSGATPSYDPHPPRRDEHALLAALYRAAPDDSSGEPEVSVVLIDLDHLHRLNEAEGRPVGDAALAHVEAIVRSRLRSVDTLARVGGDEFALVLPGLGLEAARSFAEDVRHRVDASVCVHEGHERSVTVSCGVAAWSSQTRRPWRLLREVEEHLSEAKRAGRNRVR